MHWLARQWLQPPRGIYSSIKPHYRAFSSVSHETDSCGVPLHPTWSVNELLSSYPTPAPLSFATLTRLHELSALRPPVDGRGHAIIKREMEDLVRLVEAVKLVKTDGVRLTSHPAGGEFDRQANNLDLPGPGVFGRALLQHAARILDGFYVVDADKKW